MKWSALNRNYCFLISAAAERSNYVLISVFKKKEKK